MLYALRPCGADIEGILNDASMAHIKRCIAMNEGLAEWAGEVGVKDEHIYQSQIEHVIRNYKIGDRSHQQSRPIGFGAGV
jgi:hypothetical protein